MSCPQCGSINIEQAGSRENYNMGKGMVGQAMLGDLGSLAGFENQKVWKCKSCGCRFVEGLNKNKIITKGGGGDLYFDIGTKPIEVKGSAGYTYRIDGIHLDISKDGNYRENHFEIPTLKRVEYWLDSPTLILYYLCNDGKERSKRYTDLSETELKKLIAAMRAVLAKFRQHKDYDFIMHGKEVVQIVLIQKGDKTLKQSQNKVRLILALIFALFVGVFALEGGLEGFLFTTCTAFVMAYGYMCYKNI